jgi:hypothetical protein
MTDLHDKLAAAVTDEEAREAIGKAARAIGCWNFATQKLLRGHPAGWIGIGVLMLSETATWEMHPVPAPFPAWVAWVHGRGVRGNPNGRAKRPDTALCLAALRASEAGK